MGVGSHRLRWTHWSDGVWWGTPPGHWRVCEVLERSISEYGPGGSGPHATGHYWIVRPFFCDKPHLRFRDPETAMRYADSLWDAYAARRRL